MKYIAIIKAEFGWRTVLTDNDGRELIVPIVSWGVVGNIDNGDYGVPSKFLTARAWMPLDNVGESLSSRENFVMLLSPNEEEEYPARKKDIANACLAKAKLLRKSKGI